MSPLAVVAVLTDPVLLREVVGFVRGVPFLLLELEISLEKDEWSAYFGDAALVTRNAIQRADRRALQMLYDVHRTLTLPAGQTLQVGAKMRFDDVLLWAVRIGNLSTLAWLRETFPHLKARAQIMDVAIKAGSVDLLAFLEAHYAQDIPRQDVSSCALAFAPQTKWLAIAEWLHEHGYRNCFSSYVFERVIESGDMAMLQFLHTSWPATFPGHMMYLAATTGNLDAVRILQSDPRNTKSMDTAAQNGHLEIVKFLHEVRHEACTAFAMDSSACNGFLDVVTFLHENRREGCTEDALNGAAQFGHLSVVQFLVENRSEGVLDEALERAKRKEHHEVVSYLRARLQHIKDRESTSAAS